LIDDEEVVVAGTSVKDKKTYKKVRESGASKEKAARIANAAAGQGRKKVAAKGGKSSKYDDMKKGELLDRAKEVGIKGRSKMSKKDLVKALREH
jgi:hypothetical protein